MNEDAASAVRTLQDRLAAVEARDFRRAERYEAALNDLVRNPDRSGPVGHLVRNASSYGLKRTVRRDRLAPRHDPRPVTTDKGSAEPAEVLVSHDTAAQLRVDLVDAIERAPLTDFERSSMRCLAAGWEATDIADASGQPVQRVRVCISRARAKLRAVA